MAKDQPDQYKGSKPQMDIDWENRVLCSDGNCIGVIGSDGCCKECGKPYEGKLPRQTQSEVKEPDPEAASAKDNQPLEEESTADAADIKDQKSPEESDWENRRLCSDGNCIGVIGPDDRCKECGKPYKGG